MGAEQLPLRQKQDVVVEEQVNTEENKQQLQLEQTPYGHAMRKWFMFDEKWVNLNHGMLYSYPPLFILQSTILTSNLPCTKCCSLPGSFGTHPTPLRAQLHQFQLAAERRPDHFLRYEYPALLDASRTALATLLHAPSDEIVLVPNATTGINTVLRSLRFDAGDAIVYYSFIYGACERTVEYVCATTPARAVRIELTFPCEDDDVVAALENAVKETEAKGGRVRVAVFDTVVSMPGVRLPFERLVEKCKELGVLSCVDGAHGVGQLELDLGKLDADFFISNCHK